MSETMPPPPPAFGPAWRVVLAVALLIAGGLLLAIWPALRAIGGALATWSDVIAALLLLFAAGAVVAALWALLALALRLTAQARQAHIGTLPGGLPFHVRDVRYRSTRATLADEWRWSMEQHYGVELADRQRATPLLTSQNQHIHIESAAPAQIEAAPSAIATTQALDEWMVWIDEQPHALLAGKTKAGKTHLATALLERRLHAGETVFIIDPHSSNWLGLPTAGDIASPKELKFALVAVLSEYTRRMKARGAYKKANNGQELPLNHFSRLNVLIDECNAIAALESDTWSAFATALASGSRKVGIALIILAQSPNVDDIGFSAKMRNNFAAIALDAASVQQMIDQERDKDRRLALRTAVRSATYPAAALIGADIWLLDRDGLAPGTAPAGARMQMWNGWDYANGRAVARPTGSLAAPTGPAVASPVAPPTPLPPTQRVARQSAPPTDPLPPPTVQEEIMLLLSNQSAWLTASEISAKLGVDLNVVRTEIDNLYNKAGKLVRRRVRGKTTKEHYEYQTVQSVQSVQSQLTPSA